MKDVRQMFLGINEMKYSKGRYILIVLVMMLIAWLVFVLSGLANGLAQGNRLAVDQWQADGVVLAEDANSSLNVSVLDESLKDQIKGAEVAPIGQISLALKKQGQASNDRTNISLFGINSTDFIMPELTSGKAFTEKNQVIASEDLKESGFKIGDKIIVGNYEEPLTIVGWFEKSTFNIVPVVYTSIETWREIKYGDNPQMKDKVNGFIVRDSDIDSLKSPSKEATVLKIADFIQKLPGYSAQNLTLDTMIYFLIGIASFIVGIFIFVMTLQKTAMFGVLKVQGVPTSYLAKSVLIQTGFLATVGVASGLVLTFLTSLILPSSMPYTADYLKVFIYAVLLIVVALVGGVFSIRTVAKVDPLKAIGG